MDASSELLRRLSLARLPAFPQPAFRLGLELLAAEEDFQPDQLAEHFEADPRLRYVVLIGANLWTSAGQPSIKSIRRALSFLGRRKCCDILWLAVLSDLLQGAPAPLSHRSHRLWRHALLTAVLSQRVLNLGRLTESGPPLSSGMAHDIGHLLMADSGPKLQVIWNEEPSIATPSEFVPFERDHARLGAALLELWKAPYELIAAAKFHHEPATAPPSLSGFVAGVRLADLVAEHLDRDGTSPCSRLGELPHWREVAAIPPWNRLPELSDRLVEELPDVLVSADRLANLLSL